MKKAIGITLSAIALIAATLAGLSYARVLNLVFLQSDEGYRYKVHFGNNLPLEALEDVSGGYRCYVNENEYIWYTDDQVEVSQGTLSLQFRRGDIPLLNRGG